jgi:drug/metabolite transporter (DMT)-like permease
MTPTILSASLAGFIYACAALVSKRALLSGCGLLRLSFVMNWVFLAVFLTLGLGGREVVDTGSWYWPVLAGALFFGGQVFTFAAIRVGDVSLQTPVMGTKAVFVVLIAAVLGTEPVNGGLWSAAILASAAVALLGFSGRGKGERTGLTLLLALLSSLAFAGSDVLVGTYGSAFGPRSFIVIMIAVNALLSFGLVPFFREPLRSVPARVWPWMLLASVLMGGQALLLNYALAAHGNVGVANVLYSSRGLWSVVLAAPLAVVMAMPRARWTRGVFAKRFTGAALMVAAIWLVLG